MYVAHKTISLCMHSVYVCIACIYMYVCVLYRGMYCMYVVHYVYIILFVCKYVCMYVCVGVHLPDARNMGGAAEGIQVTLGGPNGHLLHLQCICVTILLQARSDHNCLYFFILPT